LEEKYKVLSRDYQILSEEYIDLREENKRLKSNLKQMRKKVDILNVLYQHIQEQYNLLNAITESFRNQNEDLERAITSAISYLACMDRISDKESNEQLAMDVLNEALGEKK
jgi:tRNA(Glu) U13 pseudouridine synthase TruD